jgi:hypothetical protein
MIDHLNTTATKYFNKYILALNAINSYKYGPILPTWVMFFGAYKNFYEDENFPNFKAYLQDIYELILSDIANNTNNNYSSPHIKDKTQEALKWLNSDYTIKNTYLDKISDDMKKDWNLWFSTFMQIESLNGELLSILQISNHPAIDDQYRTILYSSYQEFYHSISHIYLSQDIDINDSIHKSIGHLQRASLDLVKKGVDYYVPICQDQFEDFFNSTSLCYIK